MAGEITAFDMDDDNRGLNQKSKKRSFNMTFTGYKHQQYPESPNPIPIIVYDCSVCLLPICDQAVFKVNEKYFHSSCLYCSKCRIKLLDKCYVRNGNIYCKEDFFKKFGTKCASCGYDIPATEVVQRAMDFVYHVQCFSCRLCYRQLNTGEEYYLNNDQKLVCKMDYETLKNKEFDDVIKRPRTTITQNQLVVLKQSYNKSPKPARYVRESLAAQTGLDMRVVQVWFQNRRAKEKRLNIDSNKRWTNPVRTKTARAKTHREEVTSNEYDTEISYEVLSEHDSDESLSLIRHTDPVFLNAIARRRRLQSNEFLPFDSTYT